MVEQNARTKLLLPLGGMGVAIQLLFLHWSVFQGEEHAAGAFVHNSYATGTACLMGGLLYALFLRYPVGWSVRERKISVFALCAGALGGAMATTLALQGRYLVAACFLTHTMKSGVPESSLKTDFILALLSIETYALVELIYVTIPSFLCGALATAVIARAFIPVPDRPVSASPR